MRSLVIIAAVVLGLVAGVFLILFNWFVAANLFVALGLDRIWGKGDSDFLLFAIGIYVIWLFALYAIKRIVAHSNNALLFVLVFLAVAPIPSIYGLYAIWEGCRGQHGGQCG